jgi:hypothetical protein
MRSIFSEIRPSEIFFLVAGIGILISLPWLDGGGFLIWTIAKLSYFTGVVFLIFQK